jgi:AhpD family alkylhydroperoxidase
MTTYEVQTLETAPEKSRDAMQRLKNSAGMIPTLAAMMSTSPTLIEAFVTLREIFQTGTLDAKERETLGLANAIENGCEWCVAFHSFVALKLGVDGEAVKHLRSGEEPNDARLRALTRLTRQLIAKRGKLDRAELDAFVSAGFSKDQALEVVVGLAASIMANYAGNFVHPQLDAPFQDQRWSHSAN